MTCICKRLCNISFSRHLKNSKFITLDHKQLTNESMRKAETGLKLNTSALIASKIKTSGPITVAEYMKCVLTNPVSGYYIHQDVFGTQGDFITSPEISQLFGEMIALWFVNEWTRLRRPIPIQLVELGPGRGTMMKDILRVFEKLKLSEHVSCHLVEVSVELSRLQAAALCTESNESSDKDSLSYRNGVSHSGIPIHWYYSLSDVPRGFSFTVAHEFFDALPIHKFQKTQEGWREILIDIDLTDENKFRYVISRMATPAVALFLKKGESREHAEVCPQGGVVIQEVAKRLDEDGGIALVADYGHSGDKTDTFRAFKKHKLHDPLVEPGSADLTADVDFRYLQDTVSDRVACLGPVTQREFLLRMHVEKRLEILTKNCKDEKEKESLISGFHMLTDGDKMGNCFKFMAFYPLFLRDRLMKMPPPGFS